MSVSVGGIARMTSKEEETYEVAADDDEQERL